MRWQSDHALAGRGTCALSSRNENWANPVRQGLGTRPSPAQSTPAAGGQVAPPRPEWRGAPPRLDARSDDVLAVREWRTSPVTKPAAPGGWGSARRLLRKQRQLHFPPYAKSELRVQPLGAVLGLDVQHRPLAIGEDLRHQHAH